jgi:hypothetical protein
VKIKSFIKKAGLLLSIPIAISVSLLSTPIQSFAESNPIEWIKGNWLNYPDSTGKWTTNTINGNSAIGSTQNVSWTGYLNSFALDTKNALFEFKMYQNEKNDDDNMGWTFRHTYTGDYTDMKNHSYYVFVSNNKSVNGGSYASGLYRKDVGQTYGQMKLIVPMSHLRKPYTLYNVKIDVRDESGGTRIKIWIDDEQVADYLDTKPLPKGGYGPFTNSQAHAYYYDMNINGSSVYNIPPTIGVSSPSDNTQFLPTDKIELKGYANDVDNRGTLSTYYQFDNQTQQLIWTNPQAGSNQFFDKSLSIPSDFTYGNHTLTVWAKDSENAESQKRDIPFFVKDVVKPNATHTISDNTDGTKKITINALDMESGIKRIKLPNGNYVNGPTASYSVSNVNADYNFVIEDNAGNTIAYSVSVSDVLINPVLSVTPNHVGNYIDLSWVMSDSWQTYSYSVFRKKYGDNVYSTVATGLKQNVYKDTAGKDVTKPKAPSITSVVANGATSKVVVDYTSVEDEGTTYNYYVQGTGDKNGLKANSNTELKEIKSGLKGYSIVVDNVALTTPDNTIETTSTSYTVTKDIQNGFFVHVASVDKAGNVSEVAHYNYLDSFSPSMTITPNTINKTNQDVVITVNANDNESGIKRIKLPNGTYVNGVTATFTASQNGEYEFVAEDYVGNTFSKKIVVQNIDKVAPIVTHTISPSSLSKDSTVINLTATDRDSGIKRIKLPNGNYVNASTVQYTANDNARYAFIVEDNAGNLETYIVEVDNVYHDLVLNATPNIEENAIELDWNNPFGIPSTYVLYRKNSNGEWESIPSKDNVKVLNIYPDQGIPNTGLSGGQIDLDGKAVPNSGILETWLLKEGIDSVDIDTLSLSSFNSDPDKHIKEVDGIWNYDAIFYGMWNLSPTVIYPNDEAVEYIRDFIKDGGGFMTSHHTIGYTGLDRGVNKLAPELGVEIFSNQTYSKCSAYAGRDANGKLYPTVSFEMIEDVRCDYSSYWPNGNQVKIVKKGLLTEYPFKVGEIGQSYTIPSQHGLNVFGKGEVWMQTVNPTGFVGMPFKEINISPSTGAVGTNNFYVHTYNNTAIINSGHSFPAITEAETRIIANTLYYLAQTTTETSWVDRMGMDTESPQEPNVRLTSDDSNGASFSVSAEDNGVTSEFLLKARNSKYEVQSNVAKIELKTGLKGYSYVIDTNPSTVPDNTVETTSSTIQVPNNTEFYLHVVAVDKAGNKSSVSHYHYTDNTLPTLTLTSSQNNWTNESITITASAFDAESGIKRIKLPNGNWINQSIVIYSVEANGTYTFVAENGFGSQLSKSINISNIDKGVPTAPVISNQEDWIKASSVSVSITSGTDTLSGVNRVEYKLEGATIKGWTKYTGTFSISNEGETKIIARTIDNIGLVSAEDISYVRIDNSVPYNTSLEIELIN